MEKGKAEHFLQAMGEGAKEDSLLERSKKNNLRGDPRPREEIRRKKGKIGTGKESKMRGVQKRVSSLRVMNKKKVNRLGEKRQVPVSRKRVRFTRKRGGKIIGGERRQR